MPDKSENKNGLEKKSVVPSVLRVPSEDKVGSISLYSVTLDSSSSLGTFNSIGKASIAKLDPSHYELKAVLYPQNAPVFGVSNPYYIHAILTITPGPFDKVTINCSGYAYITKIFSVTLPANNIKVELDQPLTNPKNGYKFSLNPFKLFGMSPGKMTNTGKLILLSKQLDESSANELAFCDTLDLKEHKMKSR